MTEIWIWNGSGERGEHGDLREVVSDITFDVRVNWNGKPPDMSRIGAYDYCVYRYKREEELGENEETESKGSASIIADRLTRSEAHDLLRKIAYKVGAINVAELRSKEPDSSDGP